MKITWKKPPPPPPPPPLLRPPNLGGVLRHLWQRSLGSLSLVMIGVCVGLFVVVTALDVAHVVPLERSYGFLGVSYVGVVHRLWLHQFLTAPLLHGNITHLIFNMLALWFLGPEVERMLGRARYCVFSALCAEASLAGVLAFSWGTGSIAFGYSGVIFGLFVAQAVYFPENRIIVFYFFPLKMKHAVLLFAAMELYLSTSADAGGVSSVGHLAGAVAALIYLRGGRWWRIARTKLGRGTAQSR